MKDERHFRSSTHREKVVEHLFVGELLRHLWIKNLAGTQILRSEVDSAGYDIVITHGRITRHVQLKASVSGGAAKSQKINGALADLAGGCVIWVVVDEDLSFKEFLWFGAGPRSFLTQLRTLKRAKHAKANAAGVKALRRDTWVVPKSKFSRLTHMTDVVAKLFGDRE
jgi:hypothetical protein